MFYKAADKGKNEWYLYILGFIAVACGYIFGQIPGLTAAHFIVKGNNDYGTEVMDKFNSTFDFTLLGMNSNISFLFAMLFFIFAFVALVLVMKYVHKRNFLTLVNIEEKINLKKVFFGFSIWIIMGAIAELFIYYTNPEAYTFHFNFMDFFGLLLIAIFLLPIQTSVEELFVRGYIMQGLGLLFRNKWAPIIGSALFFGWIHGSNPEVAKYGTGVMMSYYIYAGLFFGIVIVLDESLELALGIHYGTNLFGTLILGYEQSVIQTHSLFKTHDMDAEVMLFFLVITSIIFFFICSQKYNWPSISTIFEPIDYDKPSTSIKDR